MHKLFYSLFAVGVLQSCSNTSQTTTMSTTANTLTNREKNEGWVLLFDGQSTNGWHTYGKQTVGKAWKVVDGTLYLDASDRQSGGGGDLVTNEEYGDFHLKMDWKISPKGNSGVIFYVKEDPKYSQTYFTGPEMQVLDNAGHADANINKHRAGDLYDLIAAKETVKPAGEWNNIEIISRKGNLEFHMNGEKVLNTTLWDDNWRNMVAGSKFKDMPDFGKFQTGKIALQDHGDNVWYRNIKIRKL